MRNFIRILKKFSIFKRSFSFVFALIIMFSFVACQFSVATYCAEEVGIEIVAVTTGALYSAIKSGEASAIITDFFKRAVVFASEIKTSYFMPADTIDTFYNNYMYSLDSSVENGSLIEADIGNIRYVGGEPVSFDCPTLGCYAFFCNRSIADRIGAYSGQKNISVVASIVDGYWDQEFYRIRRPNFHALVSNPENWQVCFNSSDVNEEVIYQSFFETFGYQFETPSDRFFDTRIACTVHYSTSATRNIQYATGDINRDYNYFVLRIHDTVFQGTHYDYFLTCLHTTAMSDPYLFNIRGYQAFQTSDIRSVMYNVKNVTIGDDKAHEIFGATFPPFSTVDIRDLVDNYGLLLEGTDIGILNPTAEWWNAKDWEDVVDAVAQDVADAIAVGATDIPIPDVVEETDLPVTDFTDSTDFPDTTGIIALDDESDFPDIPIPNPDPDDPSGDDAPDIPQLNVPVLLTLFPFCIPFDIKRSIEWFGNSGNRNGINNNRVSDQYNTGVYNNMSASEAEEINGNGVEPVFAIPINIGVSGRPVLQSTVVLDLTEYGIPVLVEYLKTVQIITWIIVLCWGTYKVIY